MKDARFAPEPPSADGSLSQPRLSLSLKKTRVEIWHDDHLVSWIQDHPVPASPTDDQLPTVERLGYGSDTARMVRDHELAHTLLSTLSGLPFSPTLFDVSRNRPANESHYIEEDLVLSFQRFCNYHKIDILSVCKKFAESVDFCGQ